MKIHNIQVNNNILNITLNTSKLTKVRATN